MVFRAFVNLYAHLRLLIIIARSASDYTFYDIKTIRKSTESVDESRYCNEIFCIYLCMNRN